MRHIFLANCFLVIALCLCAHAQIIDTSGLAELKKGDYDNAFKLFNARLASNPNDLPAARGLLRLYLETGRYSEAETAAKKFLAKTPEAAGVRHEFGEALALTGGYNEAITEFERSAADASTPADKLESDLRRAELLDLIGQEDRAKS